MNVNKGQSAIEYILLVACVIALLIVFLAPGGIMHSTISSGINKTVDQIGIMAQHTNFASGQQPTGGENPPPGVSCSSLTEDNCCTLGATQCWGVYHTDMVSYPADTHWEGCYTQGSSFTDWCVPGTCQCSYVTY